MNAPLIRVLMEERVRNLLLEPMPVLVWLDVFRVSRMCAVLILVFVLTDINECSPGPCLNGGACSQPSVGTYACVCVAGCVPCIWDVYHINVFISILDINECSPNPCLNGGACSQPSVGTYACACVA